MSTSESRSALVMELAEEFLDRYRRGERPGLKEYIDRNPALSGEIREVFPAMAMMENIAINDDSLAGEMTQATAGAEFEATLPLPKQLGDFRIVREIGHGGMGVVYEAEQLSLGRHVALKVLPPQMVRDRKQHQRFDREAKAAAKLHHTNIVPVFGVGEHEGMAYYVMQYIQGLGIDEVIDELRRLRPRGIASQDVGPGDFKAEAKRDELPPATSRDVSAAEMAQSLLTGRFEPGPADDATSDGLIAETEAAGETPGKEPEPAGTAAGDGQHGAGSRGGERAESPLGPKSTSSSSISLPGSSRNGRSGRSTSRTATYWQSVAQVGVQVADALEYAHKQGVVHRDIKPSNLLLDHRGTVWVTDLGLAKADDHQDLTHTGDLLGTLRYMPPEAFDGRADSRGDIYSLGLTLYELLAFRPAFEQKDRVQLVRQVTTEDPPRLGKLGIKLPGDLETIVHKAIERDPAHRYQTAGELGADLQRFLDDEPIQARRLSLPERLNRWRRRNQGLAAAMAAIAAALILGSVASTLLMIRANHFAADARRESSRASRAAGLAELASEESRKAAASEAIAARTARAESARQAAARGLALIEQQDQGRGLAWLAGALELDPEDASGVHHAVRVNLARVLEEELAEPRLILKPTDKTPGPGGKTWDDYVNCLACSPDGKVLAVGYTGAVRLWSLVDGQPIGKPLPGLAGGVNCLVFSPDGRQLRVGGFNGGVSVWDIPSGRQVGQPMSFPGVVAAIRPDGRSVVVAQGKQQYLVLDGQTRKPLGPPMVNTHHRSGGAARMALSPDGKYLATGESNDSQAGVSRAALVWDIASGRMRCETGKHDTYHINAVAWSPDGKTVATGGHDMVLRLWDSATGAMRGLPRTMARSIVDLSFSPDGKTLAVAQAWAVGDVRFERSDVRILDVVNGKPIGPQWRFDVQIVCLAYTPDGRSLAVGLADGTTEVWSLSVGTIPQATLALLDDPISLAANSDGLVAIGMSTDELRLHDSRSGKTRTLMSFPDRSVWSVAFSPDGRTLAAGTGFRSTASDDKPDGEVFLIDITSGQRICPPIKADEPCAFVSRFSGDGTVFYTRSRDGKKLRVWDARSGKNLGRDFKGNDEVTFVDTSADDHAVLVVDRQGRLTRRDIVTREPLGPAVTLQQQGIKSLAIDPRGRTFATLASDSTVRLWDAALTRPLGPPIEHEGDIRRPRLHPDGRTLAIPGQQGSFAFWDGISGLSLGRSPYIPGWNLESSYFPSGDLRAVGGANALVIEKEARELAGSSEGIRRTVLLRTGWMVDASGTVAQLNNAEWRKARDKPGAAQNSSADRPAIRVVESTHRDLLFALEFAGDPFAANWYLDRVIAAGRDEPAILLLRARSRAELGQIALAEDDLEHVFPDVPENPTAWANFLGTAIRLPRDSRTRALIRRAFDTMQQAHIAFELPGPERLKLATHLGEDHRWQAAATVLRTMVDDPESTGGPQLYHFNEDLMVALINVGDKNGYQSLARKVLARAEATKNAEVLYRSIFDCVRLQRCHVSAQRQQVFAGEFFDHRLHQRGRSAAAIAGLDVIDFARNLAR